MLTVSDMPKGHGRKGGKPPAKRKCCSQIETKVPMSIPVSLSQSPASSCVVNAPIINSYNHPSPSPTTSSIPGLSYHPYVPTASLNPSQYPFKVHFVVVNISVCNGCRGGHYRELGSPYDLCIQHEE